MPVPPWASARNKAIDRKLSRNRWLKAKGLALPASKAAQRAIAADLANRPATAVPPGKRTTPPPSALSD